MNKLFIFYFLIFNLCFSFLVTPKNCYAKAPADSSESTYKKFKTNIYTLDYISRKTNNSKYFLNMAVQYCDSLMLIGKDSLWAQAFKEKIKLTLITCEDNMNHRVQLFPYFKGFPSFMGFADDAIEYAYDNSLEELLNTIFVDIHDGPLFEANISSIITRGNCDDEMFEIVKQTIMSNTNHYVITLEELNKIIGTEKTSLLTAGNKDTSTLNKICSSLNLDNLGVFYVTNMDNIDKKIWLTHSEFSTYSPEEGQTEAVFSRGFSQDKRGVLGINVLLLLLESILFIALIAVFDEKVIKFIRTRKLFSLKEMFFQFIKKVKFVSICFATPTLLSFVMIYSLSFLTPDPTDHYMESSSILWVIALTLCMSIIPTFINLFLINRLQIDGFHNIRGYRTFANASLYATYLPLFVFYITQFEHYPRTAHFLLVLLTFVIGDLIARSYFQFTSKSKHSNLKTQALAGLILGVLALIFFNTYALTEISPTLFISSLIFIAPLSIIHYGIGKYMDRVNEKKLESSKEATLLSEFNFIKDVIDPSKDIYEHIENNLSEDKLNLMLISAPMGIGKTRSLKEALNGNDAEDTVLGTFAANNWKCCYGDCDEIQDENAISYEPFTEAFADLLKVGGLTDRAQDMEEKMRKGTKMVTDISGAGADIINEFKRDENRSMTDMCVEIIDKIAASKKKTVFVMEDLHWIDPESYAFLKHFIKTVNRNEFVRGNLFIILTLRDDTRNSYRGVDKENLENDLRTLDEQLEPKIEFVPLEKDFEVKDFINHLSNQNKEFKIQEDSLADINYKFNSALSDKNDQLTITPLYILKVIEQWIQNKTLKYTPDGYVLASSIDTLELPNTDEIDAFYHSKLNEFDKKWIRILESAANIGNKFNAEILAKVWGYELLEILDFLETAEEKELIEDLSDEDNIYKFNDKRIISAIKSYFPSSQETGVKQIIIEYNKRYLELQKSIIEDPSEHSIEEVLSVVRRLTLMMSNPQYNQKAKRLIFEIIVRLIADEEFDNIAAFTSFLKNRKLTELAELISLINKIADRDTSFKEVTQIGNELLSKSYSKDSVEQVLRIYGLMFKQKRFSSEYDKNEDIFIQEHELEIIKEKINNTYKGETLISMGFLYLNCIELKFEEKLVFLDELNEKLKSSADHQSFNIYIEHLKLFLSLNDTFDNNQIDESSDLLLHKAIATNDLRLIKICLKLRIKIVTQYLKEEGKAVSIYNEYIHKLIPNNSINIHWVSFVVYFYYQWSGAIYCKENPKDAKKDLKRCEDFIYKRHNKNDWSELIEGWFNAKKSLLTETGQYQELKEVCEIHMALLKRNNLKNSAHYANICYEYSAYFEQIKDYDKLIEYRLLQIKTLENLYKNKSKPWGLKVAYTNTSMHYREYLKDYENSLNFALKALDIVENTKVIPEHSIASTYFALGRTYHFGKKNDEAIKNYSKALTHAVKAYGNDDYKLTKYYQAMVTVFTVQKDVPKIIENLEKTLTIYLKNSGKENNLAAAPIYNTLGVYYLLINKGKDQNLEFFKNALAFNLKTHGKLDSASDKAQVDGHLESYQNLGNSYHYSGDYLGALKNLKKALKIAENNKIEKGILYFNIGDVLIKIEDFNEAINFLIQGFKLAPKSGGFPFKLGICYEQTKEYEKSIENYVLCAKLRKDSTGLEHKATQDAIKEATRLAKKTNNQNLLPDWIKK